MSAGATLVHVPDITGCGLARNALLTAACAALDKLPQIGFLLLLDADMLVRTSDVQHLRKNVKLESRPFSAQYLKADGQQHWTKRHGQTLTGLGCLMMSRAMILTLAKQLDRMGCVFRLGPKHPQLILFTYSGPEEESAGKALQREWLNEDYRFCEQLGGVEISSVCVSHEKPMRLQIQQEPQK